MAVRPIDASRFGEILEQWKKDCLQDNDTQGADIISDVILRLDDMPTLTPPNEWVSVDEKLPEVGQEVLVYWRNTSQKAEHFELTHYDGDHWFLLDNTERPWIVVVAWMPLPAPPTAARRRERRTHDGH